MAGAKGRSGGKRRGAGRTKGSDVEKATKTVAEAFKAITGAIFGGDALALLQWGYKNTGLDDRTRIDCAKAAIHFERAKPEPKKATTAERGIPLAERIKEYTRRDLIDGSKGKVVELKR